MSVYNNIVILVRVMLAFDAGLDGLPFESGVEVWVLRNMSL